MRMSLEIRAKLLILGFSGGSVVKNPPANAENTGSIPDKKIPHAKEQLSPCTSTIKPAR